MSQQKRRSRRKTGDLGDLKRELWAAVIAAGELLDDVDAQVRLRAVHALSQAAACYRGLYETADLEARLIKLESKLGDEDDA